MPKRTFLLWLLWVMVAVWVYFSFYDDTDVWSFVEHDQSRMTWLIIGMFVFGVLLSLVLCIRVSLESARCSAVTAMARDGGLFALKLDRPRRKVDRFFRALRTTINGDGQADIDQLLRTEFAAYERSSNNVELIGTLLVTMGLIGTVMGLTLTLAGLTGSLDALGQDQEEMLNSLRQAMGGMSTAFYTTLLGAVLGGILLRVFAQITLNGIEDVYDKMMQTCLVYCSADYKKDISADVRALNKELEILDTKIQYLQTSFVGSAHAFSSFRDEVRRLTVGDQGNEGESLQALITQHRQYCDTLREEMRLVYALNRPWWVRFMSLLPGGK